MPEGIAAGFRDLSVRSIQGNELDVENDVCERFLLAKARSKEGKRPKKQKRAHLVRNPFVCELCLAFWRDDEGKGIAKKHFIQEKGGPRHHRACMGIVRPYSDLSRQTLAKLAAEKLFSDPAYLDFFPCMGNLVREDMPETSHHNVACPCTCCAMNKNGSMGPEPTTGASSLSIVVSHSIFNGWEEQAHKTCAAASVAGALNSILQIFGEREAQLPVLCEASESARIVEQDVLDYYCKWSKDAGRVSCHAALRGSCGLIPSTRKIGNPRLVRACHAVGINFANRNLRCHRPAPDSHQHQSISKTSSKVDKGSANRRRETCLPKLAQKPCVESDDDADDSEQDSPNDLAGAQISLGTKISSFRC